MGLIWHWYTLPETNICTPENRPSQEEMSSSNYPFSGAAAMLVAGRVPFNVSLPRFLCTTFDTSLVLTSKTFLYWQISISVPPQTAAAAPPLQPPSQAPATTTTTTTTTTISFLLQEQIHANSKECRQEETFSHLGLGSSPCHVTRDTATGWVVLLQNTSSMYMFHVFTVLVYINNMKRKKNIYIYMKIYICKYAYICIYTYLIISVCDSLAQNKTV